MVVLQSEEEGRSVSLHANYLYATAIISSAY